jgi:hypothetical protein
MEEDLGLSGNIADEPDVTSIEESEEIWIPQTHMVRV